jgi:hypothetical protein
MYERGKSDGGVVPAKPVNKAARAAAESVEERPPAKGNMASKTRPGRRAGSGVSSALDCVREVARNTRMVYPVLRCVFASDPRQEPSAVIPHVGVCAGGRPQGRSLPRPSPVPGPPRAFAVGDPSPLEVPQPG